MSSGEFAIKRTGILENKLNNHPEQVQRSTERKRHQLKFQRSANNSIGSNCMGTHI